MPGALLAAVSFAALATVSLHPSPVRAGIIPIIYGHGDTVTRMMDLQDIPEPARTQIRQELNGSVAVGFLYSRFHIYWCDLWTWNGRPVLYQDDRYWEIPPEAAVQIFGKPAAKVGHPVLYTFPLGLLILGSILALGFLLSLVKSDADRAKKLLTDPRHQRAWRLLQGESSSPVFIPVGEGGNQVAAEERFAKAADYLLSEGVPREKAESHLRVFQRLLQQVVDPLQALIPATPNKPYHHCFTVLYQSGEVLQERVANDSLTAYQQEIHHAVEEYARIGDLPGQALSAICALRPEGKSRFWLEFQPDGLPGEIKSELATRLEALPVPAVTRPVAFATHALLWGGTGTCVSLFRPIPRAWASLGPESVFPDAALEKAWPAEPATPAPAERQASS